MEDGFTLSVQSFRERTPAKRIAKNVCKPDLEKTNEYFSLGFSSRLELVRKSFVGLPLVQLEFMAEVPWVLATPEPDK